MEKKQKNKRLSLALLQIHIILWLPHIQSTTIITLQVAAQTLHHNKDVRNKSDCLSVQIRATKVDQLKLYAIVFISFLHLHTHTSTCWLFLDDWFRTLTSLPVFASVCQRLPVFVCAIVGNIPAILAHSASPGPHSLNLSFNFRYFKMKLALISHLHCFKVLILTSASTS